MAAFRVAKGLSQAALAEKLGMTRARIVYYERAATNPSFEVVEKVAAFFGVSVGELLNDTPARAVAKPGPTSRLEQLAAQAAKLPRAEQKAAIKMLEGLLDNAT
jgi:transcriptional regulator with XRE-family HTH domain